MDSHKSRIGEYIICSTSVEPYKAYMPKPLPPSPHLDMYQLSPLLEKATAALCRLDGMSTILPDINTFLYMYVRKEAVFSSQIEGTQSSLADLLLFESDETPGVPIDDVSEVVNYVAAMEYGLKRIKEDNFPLSLRLIKEIHGILLSKGRGSSKAPGEFRNTQNWIGGTRPGNARFVPPPVDKLKEALNSFEKFLHDDKVKLPTLIKAALAHLQFETIHPFLDGNGRLGRLLITFILCVDGMLDKPLLYLSLYFKVNRQQYYDHLQLVRETGNWEEWVQFFLEGVVETAEQATNAARAVMQQLEEDRQKISSNGKSIATTLMVHHYLQKHPISDASKIKDGCNITLHTVIRVLKHLENLEMVKEITGKARKRKYVYTKYLDILSQGTEPLEH